MQQQLVLLLLLLLLLLLPTNADGRKRRFLALWNGTQNADKRAQRQRNANERKIKPPFAAAQFFGYS